MDITERAPVLLVMGLQNDTVKFLKDEKKQILKSFEDCITHASNLNWLVVYAIELHHAKHSSFENQGGLLPAHCVLGTWGASYALRTPSCSCFLPEQTVRGLDVDDDSNDAFFVSSHAASFSTGSNKSNLRDILMNHKQNTKKDIVLLACGVSAFSVDTVLHTVQTAMRLGFKAMIIRDLTFVCSDEMERSEYSSDIAQISWENIKDVSKGG